MLSWRQLNNLYRQHVISNGMTDKQFVEGYRLSNDELETVRWNYYMNEVTIPNRRHKIRHPKVEAVV